MMSKNAHTQEICNIRCHELTITEYKPYCRHTVIIIISKYNSYSYFFQPITCFTYLLTTHRNLKEVKP